MGPSLDVSIALVAIAPFIAAIFAPLVQRFTGGLAGWVLAVVPAGIFIFLLGLLEPIADGRSLRAGFDWIPSHGIGFNFYIDGLSLLFALMVSGVGTLIVIYSGAYLAGRPHQGRFIGFILAFMGAMLGLVLADNLVVLFLFWELTSVTSFLLIGFDHARQAARRAAIQALVITNVGGLALLVGAVLVQQLAGTWDISELDRLSPLVNHPLYGAIFACFLVAAITKSAQFPFHFWLPNAMEAPTPVSAFLHSATMVQAGVYLLARLSPALGGTTLWFVTLTLFGGVTLLWGGFAALRQTDLKQMLAQTTVASLGLLVLLIGIGSDYAIAGMVLYFVAHAFYKAGLFMVVGTIDHETGTRDITTLGGLMRAMPLTFIATILAAVSAIGLPLSVGYLAKEEMYLALIGGGVLDWVVMVVLVLGNALLAAVAIAILVKPFFGPLRETPRRPHEGTLGLIIGSAVLGVLGLAAGVALDWIGRYVLVPGVDAITDNEITSHLTLALDPTSLLFWLSVGTWALGVLIFVKVNAIRSVIRRTEQASGWTFDIGFDAAMFGLIRLAGATTRLLHNGRLEIYLVVVFGALAAALFWPMIGMGGYASLLPEDSFGGVRFDFAWPDISIYEAAVIAFAVVALVALVVAQNRLVAIITFGLQGFSVALIFLLFGAPDLSFTQFMVEILSVVILTLVMTRLRLDERDSRPFEDALRDGTLAIVCGVGMSLLLMSILNVPLDLRLSEFFLATSVPIAHGHNVVNVILVDYRGFDTLGEIAVVMTAGIAIFALLRRRADAAPPAGATPPAPRRRRRARKTAEARP